MACRVRGTSIDCLWVLRYLKWMIVIGWECPTCIVSKWMNSENKRSISIWKGQKLGSNPIYLRKMRSNNHLYIRINTTCDEGETKHIYIHKKRKIHKLGKLPWVPFEASPSPLSNPWPSHNLRSLISEGWIVSFKMNSTCLQMILPPFFLERPCLIRFMEEARGWL